jgi:hypothetical protein
MVSAQEATGRATRLLRVSEEIGRCESEIERLSPCAVILCNEDDTIQATSALERALGMSAHEGSVRL